MPILLHHNHSECSPDSSQDLAYRSDTVSRAHEVLTSCNDYSEIISRFLTFSDSITYIRLLDPGVLDDINYDRVDLSAVPLRAMPEPAQESFTTSNLSSLLSRPCFRPHSRAAPCQAHHTPKTAFCPDFFARKASKCISHGMLSTLACESGAARYMLINAAIA
jgi:hypothetical protein